MRFDESSEKPDTTDLYLKFQTAQKWRRISNLILNEDEQEFD